jgi:hypothetical protein
MKKYGGMEWQVLEILNMMLDETELGVSSYSRLSARRNFPSTHKCESNSV